jgi:hypothetical protein
VVFRRSGLRFRCVSYAVGFICAPLSGCKPPLSALLLPGLPLPALLQLCQNLLGDFLQRVEYALPLKSDGLDQRFVLSPELL